MHIYVGELCQFGSDNGLSPGRRPAIIWTSADILSVKPQGPYFKEIIFDVQIFSFKEMQFKMPLAKWLPFCLGFNVWTCWMVLMKYRFSWHLTSLLHINLSHWGRVTIICVSNLAIIVSDNGLSPGQRQAIIWPNAGILSIRPLGTNFSGILI